MSRLRAISDTDQTALLPAIGRILSANTVPQWREAIAQAARPLEDSIFAPGLTACEIALPPSGRAHRSWQTGPLPGGDLFEDWFQRARRRPGRLCALDGPIWGMVGSGPDNGAPYLGLLVNCDGGADGAMESVLREFCTITASHLGRLRRDEEGRGRERQVRRGGADTALLRAGSDLVWEADSQGLIRVTRIFNGRRDLARHFHGRNLDDLAVGGRTVKTLMSGEKPLRMMRLDAPGPDGSPLYMTACVREGAFHGAISAGPDIAPDRLAIDVRMLENMLDVRARERELGRETEAMLAGLRLLLAELPLRERLEQLARQLAQAIGSDDVRMIQTRPGEAPRLLLPAQALAPGGIAALSQVLALGGERAVTLLPTDGDNSALLNSVLGTPVAQGQAILVALPYRAERLYLLCRTRRAFGPGEIGLAQRLSLLLQQALLLEEDQARMIHAAKLSALGAMSAGIAHELRQPLNTISIAAQNIEMQLERGGIEAGLLQEKVTRILAQVERAVAVMNRMRRFGRKSAGDYAPVSLAGIARSTRAMMEPVALAAGVEILLDVPDGFEAIADELEIEQVLVNLVQNAIDAIAGQTRKLRPGRVLVRAQADPADAALTRLTVEDSGPGFAPEVQSHAFDAFFTTKQDGMGLGLSISHAILRAHGGRLEIGNCDTGGAVSLVLPRPQAQVIPIARRRQSETQSR